MVYLVLPEKTFCHDFSALIIFYLIDFKPQSYGLYILAVCRLQLIAHSLLNNRAAFTRRLVQW